MFRPKSVLASMLMAICLLLPQLQVAAMQAPLQEENQDFYRGITVSYEANYFTPSGELAYRGAETAWKSEQQLIIARMKQWRGMGINSLCLTFPIFTNSWRSSTVFADLSHTPSLQQLSFIAQVANEYGISLVLKPTLDQQNIRRSSNGVEWRGSIEIVNEETAVTWFDQLEGLLRQYALIDQPIQPDWLVVGTELNSLEGESYTYYWSQLLNRLHRDAPGVQFAYAQNWDQAERLIQPKWFEQLDAIAIQAVFPLTGLTAHPGHSLVSMALDKYRHIPQALRHAYGDKQLFFMEVGIASRSSTEDGQTAFDAPWRWDGPTESQPDMEVQVTYLTAACHVYRQWHVDDLADGMWVSRTSLRNLENPRADNSHEVMGKPAQDTIRQCYAGPPPS
jgi:hypothetical protein